MDEELWRWIWIGAAMVLGVGEIFTAGFFMLPFALGAVAAAVLAWLSVPVAIQWIVFIFGSIAALIGLQRFVRKEDETQPSVGANRFLNHRAIVLEDVNRMSGAGRVKVETEDWRATTEGDTTIPAGTEVKIVGIRGARLVIEPVQELPPGR